MDKIILDLPAPVPTMAIDCLARVSSMNQAYFINSKIIALCFGCIGLIIGGILGYLYREKYGSR